MRQSTIDKELAEIARLRPLARRGDEVAISNIACCYRILDRRALAFCWWKRGADAGDGDDQLELGYCYQHGVGVRKDLDQARTCLRMAVASKYISPFAREEAMYHLAVLILSGDQSSSARTQALALLNAANRDNDYPQAEALAKTLSSDPGPHCVCRRALRPTLKRRHCKLHGPGMNRSAKRRSRSAMTRS